MKIEVDLVDVAGGNLGSVRRCLGRLGVPYNLVNPQNAPDGSRPIILPGVGNCEFLNKKKAIEVLEE